MMMFMPDVRNDFDLFDDVFRSPVFDLEPAMKTDISEKDGKYLMKTDLPGFSKEDIKVSLKNGTLIIHAQHDSNKDTKDKKGRLIRQERYSGAYTRSFYVGGQVKDTDVHASYKDGTLSLEFPAYDETRKLENKAEPIAIE